MGKTVVALVVGLVPAVAGAAGAEVLVLRGRGGPPPPAPSASPPASIVAAGERLWLVDPAGDRLVGCRLDRTSRAGALRIRCAERRLPERRG